EPAMRGRIRMPGDRRATRTERDSMGPMEVPADALWGASTPRAVLNFPISGERFPRRFLAALGLVKAAAAEANGALGVVAGAGAPAIEAAGRGAAPAGWAAPSAVDVCQTGSGPSTNMNGNEVIATRARQLLGPDGPSVHPNDHVNASQSSNDAIPT